MAVKIQHKRGSKAALPALDPGEFGLATDTGELFVGGQSGNLQVPVLGSDGKVPSAQLPAMNYIPTSQKGVAGGVATLDGTGKIPAGQIPAGDYFTKAQSLQAATAALFGLPASAVPDNVLSKLSGAAIITKKAKAGSVPVGSTVRLSVNGSPVDFIVVHQGRPSTLYDPSCDGAWLLMKDIYETRQWNSSSSNSYKASAIHTYLNGEFLNLFEPEIQASIKQVKIPYVNGTGNSSVNSGSGGLPCKIFLLSGYEVGWSQSDSNNIPIDGYKLSYFDDDSISQSRSKRIAYISGVPSTWWLRSAWKNNTTYALSVKNDGGWAAYDCVTSYGIRPALVLPSDFIVETADIASLTDVQGNPINIGPQIATGSYFGTGTYGTSNPNTLTFDFVPKLVIIKGVQPTVFINPSTDGCTWIDSCKGGEYHATWNGNTLSWWGGDSDYWYGGGSSTSDTEADGQLNEARVVYRYLAIG